MRFLPYPLNIPGQVENTCRYTSIKFLYVNMLLFLEALSHDVHRVLNNLLYHRRGFVKSLIRE